MSKKRKLHEPHKLEKSEKTRKFSIAVPDLVRRVFNVHRFEPQILGVSQLASIKCIDSQCSFNSGFEYKLKNCKLTTSDNSDAYDLIIECPNGHQNKIWVKPNPISVSNLSARFSKGGFFSDFVADSPAPHEGSSNYRNEE